jgi:ribonuclease G
MFESHALDQDVERALRPRVWLKSGGYIVIEPTEALVSIDVNTGKYVGTSRPEETVLKTNLEAATEIARQLRLRDLGGIIVVDFIDMASPDSRRQVLDTLDRALSEDRARTKVVGLSELGLVQLTRKRTRPGVGSLLTRPCPTCQGHGRVKDVDTVAWEALREVYRALPALSPERVTVRAQQDVLQSFAALWHGERPPDGVDRALIRLEEDPALDPESFDVEFR